MKYFILLFLIACVKEPPQEEYIQASKLHMGTKVEITKGSLKGCRGEIMLSDISTPLTTPYFGQKHLTYSINTKCVPSWNPIFTLDEFKVIK